MGHNPIPPPRQSVSALERWHRIVDDAVLAGMDQEDAVELADRPTERERRAKALEQIRYTNHFQIFGDPFERDVAAILTTPIVPG